MENNSLASKKNNFSLNKEHYLGMTMVVIVIVLGGILIKSSMLFFRLLMGIILGYALTRAGMGFAGSVNRAYRTGSTKLMKTLLWMFVITAILNIAFLFNADATTYNLWINPINTGLILGGLLFGFGMSFVSCCASGVLTDLVTGLPRALITLIFFGMGVFLGFPIQGSASWIKESWFTTTTWNGVYLPDLFPNDPLNGYLGAIVITILFAAIGIYLANLYEKKTKMENSYTGVCCEVEQDNVENVENLSLYEKLFVKPWSMKTGATVIAGVFTLLMGVTKAGWGASTPYGFWFGKFLMVFGVSPETLAEFSGKPTKVFTMPFFDHPINVQNFGIILGTIIALALAGKFIKVATSELKITFKDAVLFALGGLMIGLGTRLANGCNVGALYTPIANFSLSGWVFLVFLVLGGVFGNMARKRIYN